MTRRTGRRPGNPGTREMVLAAAREAFAELGYDRASIRHIATAAEVDPALVHHYFGAKQQLFLTAVSPPIDPAAVLPQVLADGIDKAPERLVHALLSAWDDPATGPALLATVRSAVSSSVSAGLMREFFAIQVLRRLAHEMATTHDQGDIPLRISLGASQLFGLAVTRYVLELEPLASASHNTVIAAVAPTLRRYLCEPLSATDA